MSFRQEAADSFSLFAGVLVVLHVRMRVVVVTELHGHKVVGLQHLLHVIPAILSQVGMAVRPAIARFTRLILDRPN